MTNKKKKYNFDIDGTICTNTYGEYEKAIPDLKRIEFINSLYEEGNVIQLFTARGSTTGINWRDLTIKQLLNWGVRYHTLTLGKPEADYYIDDKGINASDFFEHSNNLVDRHITSIKKTLFDPVCIKKIKNSGKLISDAFKSNKKIIFAGNGGSFSDCMHFSAELTGRFIKDRPPLPAIVLGNNISSLTAISNDYSYKDSFSRELECLGAEGDIFFSISTSGTSLNIQKALKLAKNKNLSTILLTSERYEEKPDYIDSIILVKDKETAIIQQIHSIIIHLLCIEIEKNLKI